MLKLYNIGFSYLLLVSICLVITSCTIPKTDYEDELTTDIPEYSDFEDVLTITHSNYNIKIQALNGTLYTGYNDLRLTITNIQTSENISNSDFTFLPILTKDLNTHESCPHQYLLDYNIEADYFTGYAVFTSESNTTKSWRLYLSFTDNNETFKVSEEISVLEQPNMNLNWTTFMGNDSEHYYIALVAPQKPKIAENALVAGIYKYNKPSHSAGSFPDPTQYSYSEVENFTLKLDPRMPEPSMGNHSSPNNKDLTQQNDKLYHGIVNYTMTGNWTLNFMLFNYNNEVVKGTEVSTDFTPGIEGKKSELFIDILF